MQELTKGCIRTTLCPVPSHLRLSHCLNSQRFHTTSQQ
jgi:hypothetical protein